jgi:hypothetical protein
MRHLLVILLVLAVGTAGVGYYRGWFTIATEESPQTMDITVGVDKEKVRADKEQAQEELKKLADRVTDKDKASVSKGQNEAAGKDNSPER